MPSNTVHLLTVVWHTVWTVGSASSEAPDKIRSVYQKFIGLGFVSSFAVALLYALAGRYFPLIYNTTDEVRQLASSFILILSLIHISSRRPRPTRL